MKDVKKPKKNKEKLIFAVNLYGFYLVIIDLYCIFVSETKGIIDIKASIRSMAQNRKYHIGRSGSGWGIWDADGHKVMSCHSHYHAVESLYNLMGWKWNPSKYRG